MSQTQVLVHQESKTENRNNQTQENARRMRNFKTNTKCQSTRHPVRMVHLVSSTKFPPRFGGFGRILSPNTFAPNSAIND